MGGDARPKGSQTLGIRTKLPQRRVVYQPLGRKAEYGRAPETSVLKNWSRNPIAGTESQRRPGNPDLGRAKTSCGPHRVANPLVTRVWGVVDVTAHISNTSHFASQFPSDTFPPSLTDTTWHFAVIGSGARGKLVRALRYDHHPNQLLVGGHLLQEMLDWLELSGTLSVGDGQDWHRPNGANRR